ncbi:fatty acyl CoA synthetase [Nitrospira sp.]|nr:fatty acyl CoA synthetase [Nitrospira sp.]
MNCRTARLLAGALLLLLQFERASPIASAQHEPLDLPALLARMATVQERHDSFTETRTMELLTQPVTLHGTLTYRRPHYIEKRIDRPHRERIAVDGATLSMTEGDHSRELDIDSHPVIRAYVEGIRATLAGDVAALRRHYHIILDGSLSDWALRLRPLDTEAAEFLQSVTLRGTGTRIQAVEIHEVNGDRSVMSIRESAS